MGETEGKKDEADYKRLQTFPLVRHSDMPEEMRVETMELCVTACEKFSNNNEEKLLENQCRRQWAVPVMIKQLGLSMEATEPVRETWHPTSEEVGAGQGLAPGCV
ncbi:dynein axonemal light chain 4 isoform X2 [Castor canadensis]|uniref:Dynein axonemal light chain 4 isoform X2 n=1 Tax=Castor canadensis TaxID=51338 RepID=A0AC58NG08_CASCN